MNANELADFIDGNVSPFMNDHQEYLDKATAMLRQQQAEIEALKAENQFFKDLMGDVEILRKAQNHD